MLKKTLKILTMLVLCISCSKDDSKEIIDTPDPIDQEIILTPIIESISKDFVFYGDNITINGKNFINESHETKLLINDIAYTYKSISENQIEIELIEDMGFEESTIEIKISDKKSNSIDFFLINKGWYTISEDIYVRRCYSSNNSNTLTLLYNSQKSATSYLGKIYKVETSSSGYAFTNIPQTSNIFQLEMINNDIGVSSTTGKCFFSEDGFESSINFADFWDSTPAHDFPYAARSTYLDGSSSIVTDGAGSYFYTQDKGATSKLYRNDENGFSEIYEFPDGVRRRDGCLGSDGYFYEIGGHLSFDHQYIVRSANGYDNWELVNFSTIWGRKIIDYDLILRTSNSAQLEISKDFGETWKTIKDNVQSFFIKDKTTWYIVSENALYCTINSGETWILETELPLNSGVGHMSFYDDKILLGGTNILMIKHL